MENLIVHENCSKTEKTTYKTYINSTNNVKHGVHEKYYANGDLKLREYYTDGVLDGEYVEYTEENKYSPSFLRRRILYSMGKEVIVETYDGIYGALVFRGRYENGVEVEYITFSNSNLKTEIKYIEGDKNSEFIKESIKMKNYLVGIALRRAILKQFNIFDDNALFGGKLGVILIVFISMLLHFS